MDVGVVQELWRYPVKSMGGETLPEAAVGSGGFAEDRGWAVRESESGKVASAKMPRTYAKLLDFHARAEGAGPDAVVTVTGPDRLDVRSDEPDHAAALTTALGRAVVLERAEQVDASYEAEWPAMEGLVISNMTLDLPVAMSTEKTSYVDLAALHLLSSASLAALAALAPASTVDVRRFRPNVLIDTGDARGFVDTDWVGHAMAVGEDVVIRVTDNATRCVMTTLAQGDLGLDSGVLQALATHNLQEFGGLGRSACIGVYAEVVSPGRIRVGDTVRVVD